MKRPLRYSENIYLRYITSVGDKGLFKIRKDHHLMNTHLSPYILQ